MLKKVGFMIIGIILLLGLGACNDANTEKIEKAKTPQEIIPIDGEEDMDDLEEYFDEFDDMDDIDEQTELLDGLVVGETADFDGFKITLNESRIEPGGEFDIQQEEQFVVVNITIENHTDEEKRISPWLNFELKDEEGYTYLEAYLTEGIRKAPDGTLLADEILRGDIPFDVPVSDSYKLYFSDDDFNVKAIWTISASELE
ncbi:DUF4352 domain-containing protein [Amphibacillus sp. Q70]|uniref:DUF4352 domain-containing protein n=1 Tax=Amphibacillus sp. Q70 TaxID=3453416 RepID=UPI003F82C2CB